MLSAVALGDGARAGVKGKRAQITWPSLVRELGSQCLGRMEVLLCLGLSVCREHWPPLHCCNGGLQTQSPQTMRLR